jgi:hypothetical protein
MVRYLVVFILCLPLQATANSCCGQTPASYMVLYQHQKYSISPSLVYTQSLGRVYESKDFHVWPQDKQRRVQMLNLNSAVSLGERGQVLISSSYVMATYQEQGDTSSASSFSDTQLGYSYELLPEYTYSAWKPVIYMSALVNLPTGHSIYDKNRLSEGADVTGHDQWGGGVGLTARKVIFPFTLLLQGKVLRLLPKDFATVNVSGFFDSSLAGFATYATRYWELSFTGGLTYNELSSRRLSTSDQASGRSKVTTVIFSVQKPISDTVSLSFAFSDQSLLGSPQNTLLNRSYNMNVNYNYF